MRKAFLFFLLCSAVFQLPAQSVKLLQSGRATSIRALSVVDDSVAWVSGSKGWVGRTTDRGRTWQWEQLAAYAALDFRDIEAFSSQRAVMVSAGTPAIVLLTTDGGKTWKETYRNESPDIFLDGMDFWDEQRGIIYGDPIAHKMQLFETRDGGEHWTPAADNLKEPLHEGEASFAASGTAIRTLKDGHVWIVTGGTVSRVFHSADYGQHWQVSACPVTQGKSSTGAFSVLFTDARNGVVAGGDYAADTVRTDNLVLTHDGGKTWQKPATAPLGFRSGIERADKNVLIATGTSGTDISRNNGKDWKALSKDGFHVVRRSKKGNWVVLAGGGGRVAEVVE
jgi:photosystem II stability/assembly factor-like uncharacterized protein